MPYVSYGVSEGGVITSVTTPNPKYNVLLAETTFCNTEPAEGYEFVAWTDGKQTPNRTDMIFGNLVAQALYKLEGEEAPEDITASSPQDGWDQTVVGTKTEIKSVNIAAIYPSGSFGSGIPGDLTGLRLMHKVGGTPNKVPETPPEE